MQAFLGVCLLVILARYILMQMSENGYTRTRLRLAVAIFTIVVGVAGRSMWFWMVRFCDRHGVDMWWTHDMPYALTAPIFTGIAAIGLLCTIRVVSDDAWGDTVWMASALAVAGLVTYLTFGT